jgi:hypothetical protein
MNTLKQATTRPPHETAAGELRALTRLTCHLGPMYSIHDRHPHGVARHRVIVIIVDRSSLLSYLIPVMTGSSCFAQAT